jgi:uncharacterized surface protein with fasciclin (FAS1) repeats
MIRFKYSVFVVISALVLIVACDEWDDHNKPAKEALNENLLQAINKTPALSKFSEYLATTGYDQVLASSKSFTVWAPDDQALETLSPDIINDIEKLTQFVGNHITYQEYFTESAQPSVRVKMLNGKSLTWQGDNLEGAAATTVNVYVRNGVLHIISEPVVPRMSNWEFLLSSPLALKQSGYFQSQTYEQFVDSLANQTGIDPQTGTPVYEPGTGIVVRNRFFEEVYDFSNEDSLYTVIALTDDAFNTEFSKLDEYFTTVTLNQDSTNNLTSWHLTKDLVFKGLISPDALPDTLVSQFGVKVPVDKSAIVETYMSSNGIVYVMNKVDFRVKDKFPPIIIQGEQPDGFSRTDKDLNIHYRYRDWADGGFDLRVLNHGVAQFNVRYKLNGLPAMTYKVYWRAINDFVDTTFTSAGNNAPYANVAAFQQKVVFDFKSTYVPSSGTDLGFDKVHRIKGDPDLIGVKLVGDYNHVNYRSVYLFVIANNVGAPPGMNPIVIDYIKLVPVL